MKKFISLIVVVALLGVTSLFAATFYARSVATGTDLKFYVGTADTATTFNTDDAWATNRTYVNAAGTTVTPKATNSVTGQIYTEFGSAAPSFGAHHSIVEPTTLTVSYTQNAALTNTTVVSLIRSTDGGTYFEDDLGGGTSASNTVTVTLGIAGGVLDNSKVYTVTTNLPAAFLTGASHFKLHKVVIAANPTDAAILTIKKISIGGYAP